MIAFAAAIVSILAMLFIGQAFLYFEDTQESEQIAERAAATAVAIAKARQFAAQRIRSIDASPCSDEDIRALKAVAFNSTYMSDVGRIQDGRLICSALWGDLGAVTLPPSRHVVRGIEFWSSPDLAGTPYSETALIAEDGAFVVSSPSIFESIDPAHTSSISIETKDRSFVYRQITSRNGEGSAAHSLVHSQECSSTSNTCVYVTSPRRMFWELPGKLTTIITVIGILVGLVLSYLPLRIRTDTVGNIQGRLNLALLRQEIEIVYQPLRRISDGTIVGFEALSRWRPPGEEEIPPTLFIPAAHQFGLSPALFRYVLSRVAEDLAPGLKENRSIYVSINAETVDIAQEGIVARAQSICSRYNILESQIKIEITERDQLTCPKARLHMEKLAENGHEFLIDDFGTGSSNFSHFSQSPFKAIKIDRMFSIAITEDSPLAPVLPGMCKIAADIGLEVIAEGIETAEQDAALRQISDKIIGQGWFYGKPMAAGAALSALQECRRL
ncbi:MAG: EAL domain-containing protein [Stenotrophomonas sp.]